MLPYSSTLPRGSGMVQARCWIRRPQTLEDLTPRLSAIISGDRSARFAMTNVTDMITAATTAIITDSSSNTKRHYPRFGEIV